MQRESVHESFERTEEVEGSSNRGFGLVFLVVLGAIAAWQLWRGRPSWPYWAAVAAAFGLAAWLAPVVLAPLNSLWTRFAILLSRVTTPVVMALLFYGTVLPTGMIMRLLARDPLRLKWQPGQASYWIERNPPGPPPESLKNQF